MGRKGREGMQQREEDEDGGHGMCCNGMGLVELRVMGGDARHWIGWEVIRGDGMRYEACDRIGWEG